LLLGKELDYVENGYIAIEDTRIISAAAGNYKGSGKRLDAKGFLIMPGFINAHTHIADSIAKDVAASDGLDARVHPVFGAKKNILQKSQPEHLDRKSTRLNSSHVSISYAVFCLKKKKI